MAEERSVQTTKIGGGADYAKVAERLKLFREDWPKSKTETDHKYNEDGSLEFMAWVWKDKTEYLKVLMEVKDRELARGSADADGSSKGTPKDKKEFEKLQTIAIGRALANLGYLGSGDVASFEEMEEYYNTKEKIKEQAVNDAVTIIEMAPDLESLKKAYVATGMMQNPAIVAAKDKRKAELTGNAGKEPEAPEKPVKTAEKAPEAKPEPVEEPKRPRGGKPVASTLPLDEEPADENN